MARLRQQHPQNYVNSGNIHTDFENIIRYLNTAERGNKTVGELFAVLFDERGQFRGPIEFRVDPVSGFQYRVGEYRDAEDGWEELIDIGSLRGPAGASVGFIEGPFFYNKATRIITTGVNTVTITNGGSGYVNPPPVVFSAPQDNTGARPIAVAVVDNGAVVGINITSPGTGYISTPTVSIGPPSQAGGVQATATCTLAALTDQSRVIPYSFDFSVADIVVYKNGVLLGEETIAGDPPDYTYDANTNTVTIASPPGVQLADKITIYSVRSQSVTNYRRQDTIITGSTSIIPFIHTPDERILVWRNGILQEEGGNADYLASPASNTITFLDPQGLSNGDKISVMTVENLSLKTVAGLMFEDNYTDGNGFIRWNKLAVQNDEIPLQKVNSLAPTLAAKANITISNSTPQEPATGDLWLDVARVPAILKFYDGTQWLQTSPESSLPTFVQSNAGQYVRVNGTGTGLEYGNIDFSALVPKTFMGAANGVASLNTDGKLPISQLPEIFSTQTISLFSPWEDSSATVTNKTYFIGMVWKQKLRIDGITHKLGAGTCTIQLAVDGVTVGTSFPVTSTRASVNMPSVIEIDGTVNGRRLELVVTNASAAATLDVGLAAATLNI